MWSGPPKPPDLRGCSGRPHGTYARWNPGSGMPRLERLPFVKHAVPQNYATTLSMRNPHCMWHTCAPVAPPSHRRPDQIAGARGTRQSLAEARGAGGLLGVRRTVRGAFKRPIAPFNRAPRVGAAGGSHLAGVSGTRRMDRPEREDGRMRASPLSGLRRRGRASVRPPGAPGRVPARPGSRVRPLAEVGHRRA
jgi:hypothetical protein